MRKVWTPNEDERLRNLYPQAQAEICAAVLHCTTEQVWARAKRLGLKRPREAIADLARQRTLEPDHPGRRHQFRRGQTPWNKGTHYTAGGRSGETRFKRGRRPEEAHNYAPIGALRVVDGYLQRKVTDDQTLFPTSRWVSEHTLVWMAAHGDVPAGHIVVFKPGRRTADEAAITLDSVELISRAEHAIRNRGHHYPPELKEAIRTLRKLRRTIQEVTS